MFVFLFRINLNKNRPSDGRKTKDFCKMLAQKEIAKAKKVIL